MKILISTDIEGVAGVVHAEQTRPGNPEYERARLRMADEASAAVAGAFDGGASAVLVNDSHGHFRNLPPDRLDPRAQVIQGKPRYLSMMAGVDDGVQGVCLIGYHSRAQGRGILAHTISSFAFARVFLNDAEVGEAGLYGALAGEYGVPVIMGSGDDVFIAEHRPLFPQAVFVQTKRATGHASGISLSPAEACRAIRQGVASALASRAAMHPRVVDAPVQLRVQTHSPGMADLFCQWPTLRRLAGDEIGFDAPTVEAGVRMLNCLSAMATALR